MRKHLPQWLKSNPSLLAVRRSYGHLNPLFQSNTVCNFEFQICFSTCFEWEFLMLLKLYYQTHPTSSDSTTSLINTKNWFSITPDIPFIRCLLGLATFTLFKIPVHPQGFIIFLPKKQQMVVQIRLPDRLNRSMLLIQKIAIKLVNTTINRIDPLHQPDCCLISLHFIKGISHQHTEMNVRLPPTISIDNIGRQHQVE